MRAPRIARAMVSNTGQRNLSTILGSATPESRRDALRAGQLGEVAILLSVDWGLVRRAGGSNAGTTLARVMVSNAGQRNLSKI
jgi:hypothetical protein